MFHTRGASLNMGNVFLPIPRLQNKALNIYLSSCCLITPNLALYWTEKFCSFSFWILSKISFTESFSTLLSQVNRRDGGNGIRGRSRDGGGQGRQNLPTHIERIKCKKNILGKTGRWASWGWRVGGLSQAFHNLGICWSAESRAGNLVIRQKFFVFCWMKLSPMGNTHGIPTSGSKVLLTFKVIRTHRTDRQARIAF